MAMLLAMYQKMRLIREKNQATLDLAKFSSKYDRVSKNIERVQKMYTDRKAKLEAQAKRMQNSASIFFRQSMNLGVNDFNTNFQSYNGLNGYKYNAISNILKQNNVTYQDASQQQQTYPAFNDSEITQYMQEYQRTGGSFKNSDGKLVDGLDETKANFFLYAKSMADISYQNAQNQCSMMTQGFQDDISIWLEAQTERLEAEQDEALEPLNYQQTMWELEKTQAEEKLTRVKEELNSYKELCKEEARDHAPHFGLG